MSAEQAYKAVSKTASSTSKTVSSVPKTSSSAQTVKTTSTPKQVDKTVSASSVDSKTTTVPVENANAAKKSFGETFKEELSSVQSNSESYSYEEPYYEEVYDEEDGTYQAHPVDLKAQKKEAEKLKSRDTNKKIGKAAVQAVATYFGGPVGGTIASVANNSGTLDPVYDKIADATTKATKIAPGGQMAQDVLNKLNDEGVIDKAADAIDLIGSGGKGKIASEAGKQAGKQAGKEAAKKVGDEAVKKAGEEAAKKSGEQVAKTQAPKQEINKQKKVKENKNSGILDFLMKHPGAIVFLLSFGVFLVLGLIIFLVIIGSAGGSAIAESYSYYVDPSYDFNETIVILTNNYSSDSNKTEIDEVMIDEFILGVTYSEMYNSVKDLSEDEKSEAYKSFIIVAKSLALAMGNYNSETKQIELHSGSNGLPYCDIDRGCDVYKSGSIYTYVPSGYTGSTFGSVVSSIPPMSSEEAQLLKEAYTEVEYKILTPNNFEGELMSYTYGTVAYNSSIKSLWIQSAKDGSKYEEIITNTNEYNGWKIYDLREYTMQYQFSNGATYWWPIGGKNESNGIYSGNPTTTKVTSDFGWRTIQGNRSYHKGIDIGGTCNSHVVIATRAGTVKKAYDGCDSYGSYGNSCGGGFGNYVMIDHGDGTVSIYAHLYKDSVAVAVGDDVKQGQKIGMLGSSGSSTGCHLHFEMRINNDSVNPLDYMNASNPRPAGTINSGYAEGTGNAQTVCLSLKASGFSDSAVAAIMVNMQAESGFRTTALGDNGTSYGLCQWHNGRYSRLQNYCSDEYDTVKCQLSYLIYELQISYAGVYSYLLTNNDTWDMAKYYCMYFEVPANRETTCANRADKFADTYESYVKNGCN